MEPSTGRGDRGMGMEHRRDWEADVHLASASEAARIEQQSAPAEESLATKLLVAALAVAGVLTLGWLAFLCHLIGRFLGTLF
jgi:hypothetical protein